jgi:hypothetical protein
MRTLILLLAIALPVRDAVACRCVPAGAVTGARESPIAFLGRVVHEHKRDDSYSYTVAVEGVWKGKVAATVEIEAGTAMGDCSIGRLRGERWLFITNERLRPSLCGGTQPATAAVIDEMTKAFGAPAHP